MIISADLNNKIDGTAAKVAELFTTDIPIIPITRIEDYVFNTDLLRLDKYILLDYIEYGANDWDRKETHEFGVNTENFRYAFPGDEWMKFDEFVEYNPPLIHFKRELLKKDMSDFLQPLEYPCWGKKYPFQSKQIFINRRIELFHYWGWSHESRRIFHGKVWEHAANKGIYMVDNLNFIQGALDDVDNKRLWASVNIPHFARVNMDFIFPVLQNSLMALSLPGAGVKCFRHGEIPTSTIMVIQEDELAWSHEWVHGFNCIKVPIGNTMKDYMGLNGCPEIPAIEEALQRTDLYKIYLEGLANNDKYRPENYIPYLENKINEVSH